MWPFANTRRSFVFVRFCDSDAHLCSRTGLFANSSFVFVRDLHFREHRSQIAARVVELPLIYSEFLNRIEYRPKCPELNRIRIDEPVLFNSGIEYLF